MSDKETANLFEQIQTLLDAINLKLGIDASGILKGAEQYAPLYENNADAVASSHDRPLGSASYNAIPYDCLLANAGNIKPSTGNLYSIIFANSGASAVPVALCNVTTVPGTGTAATSWFMVPAGGTIQIRYVFGKRFATGIAWAQSTTLGGSTIGTLGTASITVSAEFM